MRRFLAVLALALAACGADDEAASTSTTASSSTSTSTSSTTVPSTTSPSAPGETDLADGRHAVFMTEVDVTGRTVTVDVIQWLTGEEANEAYEEETGDPSGVPNDYFIKNENPRLRTLAVSDDVEVQVVALGEDSDADLGPLPFVQLPDYIEGLRAPEGMTAWITVEGGVVTAVEEQYRP